MSQLLPPDSELINAGETFASDRHTAGDPGASDWCSSIDFGRYMELRAVYGKSHEQAKYEVQTWLRTQLPNLPALPARVPKGNEHGALRTDDRNFIDANGQAWLFAGYTLFTALIHVLDHPEILDQPISLGANTFIVFDRFGGPGWQESYNDTGVAHYDRVSRLWDLFASRGVRCEHVALPGAWLMPDQGQQLAHWAELGRRAQGRGNIFLRVMNEVNGIDAARFPQIDGVLCCRGTAGGGNPCPLPAMDYSGFELRRDYPKFIADTDLIELVTGYGDHSYNPPNNYPGFAGPVVHIEPPRFGPKALDGRNIDDPRLALLLGVMCSASEACGGVYHGTEPIYCQALAPESVVLAQQFYRGLYAGFVR